MLSHFCHRTDCSSVNWLCVWSSSWSRVWLYVVSILIDILCCTIIIAIVKLNSCNGKAYFDGQSMGLQIWSHSASRMKCYGATCINFVMAGKLLTDERLIITNHLYHRTTVFTQCTVLCKSHEDAGGSVPIPYNSYLKWVCAPFRHSIWKGLHLWVSWI